ncbi:MAG TPA: hypothetical protein DD666_16015 [Advenella kashmirensis]|uniref:Uncharacterized protein n=1 Tax=Advenella kashmirensis TaxID=310575 RepID=A0A356LJ73_9BURK|nr:hypothetical protein [Advenella kashmirensis]
MGVWRYFEVDDLAMISMSSGTVVKKWHEIQSGLAHRAGDKVELSVTEMTSVVQAERAWTGG